MSQTVFSFSASNTDREALRRILAHHLAYDRARLFRIGLLPWMAVVGLTDFVLRAIGEVPGGVFWAVLIAAGSGLGGAVGREMWTRIRFDRAAAAVRP